MSLEVMEKEQIKLNFRSGLILILIMNALSVLTEGIRVKIVYVRSVIKAFQARFVPGK